ncbi:GntR family transcriptional regulator, partial [Polymorphospora sp. NPDC051019]|uniref:GntR family transcriptional regulator n=1 Tax=Polymorphospora sp. NPDC051019 TaxID=3155725 RepID=UPI00343CC64B
MVDVASPSPVYEQIRSQIAAFVRTGVLREGDRLPTVRALAADLGIAVNTVARAYQELQAAGLVRVARRHGTVVTVPPDVRDVSDLRHMAEVLSTRAAAQGVDHETVLALVTEALRRSAGQSGASA